MLRGVEEYVGQAEEERREREKIVVVEDGEKEVEAGEGAHVKEEEGTPQEQPLVAEVTDTQ